MECVPNSRVDERLPRVAKECAGQVQRHLRQEQRKLHHGGVAFTDETCKTRWLVLVDLDRWNNDGKCMQKKGKIVQDASSLLLLLLLLAKRTTNFAPSFPPVLRAQLWTQHACPLLLCPFARARTRRVCCVGASSK